MLKALLKRWVLTSLLKESSDGACVPWMGQSYRGRGQDTEGPEPPKVWRVMRATESRPMTEDRSVRDWVQQVRPQLQDQGVEGFVSEKKDN